MAAAVAVTVVICRRKREARDSELRDRVGVPDSGSLGMEESSERRSIGCGSEWRD